MFKTMQLTVRNLRGISRLTSIETYDTTQTCSYGKYTPRKVTSIVNEDELFDVEENITYAQEIKKTRGRGRRPKIDRAEKEHSKSAEVTFEDENKEYKPAKATKDAKSIYTKLYENEKIVSSIMMSVKSKKRRKKNEQILLEGVRFIEDAMEAQIVPEYIFFSRWEDIKHIEFPKNETKLFKLTYRTIQLWSSLVTCPGVMGIFKKPEPLKVKQSSLPITIICDNIRDPGNLGSILRAAAGVGVEKVLLTKGCVDFWNSKVLRSATGAHFRIPIFDLQEWDQIKASLSTNAQIYVADNKVDSYIDDLEETETTEPNSKAEESEVEEITKRIPKKLRKKVETDNLLDKYPNIPVIPYYAVDYTQNDVVLIIGGETEGLSDESYDLIKEREGIRVNIPLDNNMDSLNAGMALGVVAFEVKRQLFRMKK